MKQTPTEQRALLRRIEEGTTTAQDALVIESLFDESSDGSLLLAIREMTAAMTESAGAEAMTAGELQAWRDRLDPTLARLTKAEEERTVIAREELQVSRERLAQEGRRQELQAGTDKSWIDKVWGPVVVGVLGIAASVASYLVGSGLGQ